MKVKVKVKVDGNKKLLMNKVKGSNIRLTSPSYTSQKIL